MHRVYLTALTNERYIPGVMALARSLREVKSDYDLAIMIPEEKQETLRAALYAFGVLDVPGTFLLPKEGILLKEENNGDIIVQEKYSYWKDTFFKIQAASCTDFSKVILLDCDQMVVKNIDHLFEQPAWTATTCGRCVHADWVDLSSGLLVLEPSQKLYERLISFVVPSIELKKSRGQQAGDQDVFNMAFPTWRENPELYLHEKYNICWGWISNLCKTEKCKPKDFFMIHFPGKEKPWDWGKLYYLRLFCSLLMHCEFDKLIYKVLIWKKYRNLCEPF